MRIEKPAWGRPRWLALALVPVLTIGCSAYVTSRSTGQAAKIPVCHKGKKTIKVAEPALKAHLAHGDYRGPCR